MVEVSFRRVTLFSFLDHLYYSAVDRPYIVRFTVSCTMGLADSALGTTCRLEVKVMSFRVFLSGNMNLVRPLEFASQL